MASLPRGIHQPARRPVLQGVVGSKVTVRRVVVLGRGGAGKSVVALRIGELARLPVTELDQKFWSADSDQRLLPAGRKCSESWRPPPRGSWTEISARITPSSPVWPMPTPWSSSRMSLSLRPTRSGRSTIATTSSPRWRNAAVSPLAQPPARAGSVVRAVNRARSRRPLRSRRPRTSRQPRCRLARRDRRLVVADIKMAQLQDNRATDQ